MLKKLILSCVTLAAIGLGLTSTVATAEAHHFGGNSGIGFGLYLGPPPHYDDCYYDNGYCDNGDYNNGQLTTVIMTTATMAVTTM